VAAAVTCPYVVTEGTTSWCSLAARPPIPDEGQVRRALAATKVTGWECVERDHALSMTDCLALTAAVMALLTGQESTP
jgi:hypothetical protein